jgi:hypothetical protein
MARPMQTPAEYLKEIVEPAYADFLSCPTLPHRAVSATTIIFHFHERLFTYFEGHEPARLHGHKSASAYRDSLVALHPDLGVLRDASDSVKHQFPTRKTIIHVATSTDVTNLVGEEFVLPGGVLLSAVLASVMDFWRQLLATGIP